MAATGAHEIAAGVHGLALGRGPLATNVYLVQSGSGWVLVDAGWRGSAAAIERAATSLCGSAPRAILLTHIHPDHSGAAGTLARRWRVPVYGHPDELPMARGEYLPEFAMPLDRYVVVPLMRLLPDRVRARSVDDIADVTFPLDPEGRIPGVDDWRWVHTPGHTPGSVAYLRPADGVLISGDALLTVDLNSVAGLLTGRRRLAGPPRYTTWNWPAAQRSLAALAELRPQVLAPGHGAPMPGAAQEVVRLADAARVRRLDRILVPVGDPGRSRYRPPPRLYARLQWLGHLLTRAGLSPGYVVTLEVPGRRTGAVRRTNLVLAAHEGSRYLVSLTGEAEWVRNARAAGGRVVLSRSGRRQAVILVDVPPSERPAIVRSYVLRAGRRPGSPAVAREARAFFGVGADLSPEEIARVADRFPVFRVAPGRTPVSAGGPNGSRPAARSS
jgi:glyoxylase-like metal-dependent hydrolase (beta-lactamase superfamily II)